MRTGFTFGELPLTHYTDLINLNITGYSYTRDLAKQTVRHSSLQEERSTFYGKGLLHPQLGKALSACPRRGRELTTGLSGELRSSFNLVGLAFGCNRALDSVNDTP